MNSSLRSIKVLELSGLAPGPYCGMVLSDFGADVIRIDRVYGGGLEQVDNGLSRGKRSISLDMKSQQGKEAFIKMIEKTDVLIEPFRPGVMERLGLGPSELLLKNERLIYTRLTGWGQQGNLSKKAGHDINYISVSGVLNSLGRSEEKPYPPINLLGDFAGGGMLAVVGILLALFERSSSGRGQVVDAAMVDGSCYLSQFLIKGLYNGLNDNSRGKNLLDTGAPFYDTYKTSDNMYMAVGSIEKQFYIQLLKGLNFSPQEMEEYVQKQMDSEFWPIMKKRFSDEFASKTRSEWEKIFSSLDACVTPVLSFQDASKLPHNQERQLFLSDESGELQASPAPRLSRTPARVQNLKPPVKGDHTIEVLKEYGFSKDQIETLSKEGIIFQNSKSSL